EKIGIKDPKGKDKKDLIVFVEIDRCATDAIQSVTGCRLGKRTMKFLDYGKMAATFLNLRSRRAVRIVAKEESRGLAKKYFPDMEDKYEAQLEAYKAMTDEELFVVMDVHVDIKPEDMPGRPVRRIKCSLCGEYVQDMRDVSIKGSVFCKPCAAGGYYRKQDNFSLPSVMQKSHNDLNIRSKLWIEVDDEPVFGRGRRFLLEAIEKYGSINQAAREINISYKKALSYIKAMEERLGLVLVKRRAGGKNGGGSHLTKEAREFIDRFERIEKHIHDIADDRFKEVFNKDA
ncbi:MAG: FmdE family protein, partial [Thermodesulfovibrionales bacterium]